MAFPAQELSIREATQPDGTIEVIWALGHAQIKRIAPGVMFFRKVGHFPEDTYKYLVPPFQREIARSGSVCMVCDCGKMTGHDPLYRKAWTNFFKAQRGAVQAHIYLESAIVRMAITTVNLLTDGVFTTHSSIASLETVLRQRVPTYSPSMLPAPLGKSA